MDKESIYFLQKVDCNCNDCIFMVRDINKFNESLERHNKWQLDYFNVCKNKLIVRAKEWKDKGDMDKHDFLIKEANNMKFLFSRKTAMINYGHCNKLNKEVSFIPNFCQIETQECFKHRKDE